MTKIQILHGYENYDDGEKIWERMVFPLADDVLAETDGYYDMYTYEVDRYFNALTVDLDLIYRENQTVDGNEVNVQNKARSLVVGDLIAVSDEDGAQGIFAVATHGFHKLSADEAFAAALKVRS